MKSDGDPLIELHSARDLLLGPEWDQEEPSALFDGNAGDYWILSPTARAVVTDLQKSAGGKSKRHLLEAIAAAADEDVEAIIDELVKLDIRVSSSL